MPFHHGQLMNKKPRRFGSLLLRILLAPFLVYFGMVIVLTVTYKFVNPPVSTLMLLRRFQGQVIHPIRFVTYFRLPLFARKGIVHLEDPTFWTNDGIDLGAIRDAWEIDQKLGRPVYGGSTITQQLARTLFLFPDKSYLRKGLEIATALIMNAILGKRRILELYLNSIEWGPGIFGINAAAHYWYHADVRDLSADHLARLEAIIVNPRYFRPYWLPERGGVLERYQALMGR